MSGWIPIPGLTKEAHDLIDAADHGSGEATDGQVLTADGAGGAAWEDPTGGSGGGAYAETIGDGSEDTFQINHELGTEDLVVQLWDLTGADPVEATGDADSITVDDEDNITVAFSAPPAMSSYRVVILGSGGTPSSGSAGVPGWITYLAERMPDETPNADDDFFDDADDSGWTKLTVSGNATWVEADGILSVNFDSQTAGDLAAALYPLTSPSAPVVLETAISGISEIDDFWSYGIGFADGVTASDDVALIRHVIGSTAAARDAFFQSAGTMTDYTGGVNNNLTDFRIVGGLLYMRIVWSSANTFASYVSSNGRNWRQIGSTFSRTMTPTHAVLLGTAQGGGSEGAVASFHYLRRN